MWEQQSQGVTKLLENVWGNDDKGVDAETDRLASLVSFLPTGPLDFFPAPRRSTLPVPVQGAAHRERQALEEFVALSASPPPSPPHKVCTPSVPPSLCRGLRRERKALEEL